MKYFEFTVDVDNIKQFENTQINYLNTFEIIKMSNKERAIEKVNEDFLIGTITEDQKNEFVEELNTKTVAKLSPECRKYIKSVYNDNYYGKRRKSNPRDVENSSDDNETLSL